MTARRALGTGLAAASLIAATVCAAAPAQASSSGAATGPSTVGYYGEGGIQEYTFGIEDWAFDQYETFMADLRTGNRTDAELRADLIAWQESMAATIKAHYVAGTIPTGAP